MILPKVIQEPIHFTQQNPQEEVNSNHKHEMKTIAEDAKRSKLNINLKRRLVEITFCTIFLFSNLARVQLYAFARQALLIELNWKPCDVLLVWHNGSCKNEKHLKKFYVLLAVHNRLQFVMNGLIIIIIICCQRTVPYMI